MTTQSTESQPKPQWEIRTQDGQALGSHDVASIARLIQEGRIHQADLVRSGDTDWQSLKDSPLMGEFAVKVLLHPIRAYVDSAASVGMVIGVLAWGLVGLPLALVQELHISIVRAVLAGVVTLIFIPYHNAHASPSLTDAHTGPTNTYAHACPTDSHGYNGSADIYSGTIDGHPSTGDTHSHPSPADQDAQSSHEHPAATNQDASALR